MGSVSDSVDRPSTPSVQPTRPEHGLGIVTGNDSLSRAPGMSTSTTDWTPRIVDSSRTTQTPDLEQVVSTTAPSTAGLSGITQCGEVSNDRESLFKGFDDIALNSTLSLRSPPETSSWFNSSERNLLPKSVPNFHNDDAAEERSLPGHTCNSSINFKQSMWTWPSVGFLILSVFATALSGIFFFVAVIQPGYKRKVGTHGTLMTASTAAFITSLLAKLIEISFVTLVVALIGQMLARKAYNKDNPRGVTLAEMTMRSWAVQPGQVLRAVELQVAHANPIGRTIFSHWPTVQHAALSRLGALTLVATIVALLYTSAATALVQPQLRFSDPELRVLKSQVHASYANSVYLAQQCKSPISELVDKPDEIGKSCLQIEHAAQAYHNYQSWLTQWADAAKSFGNASRDLSERPPGYALLNDNTTVTAPWVNLTNTNMTYWRDKTGWMVNNVTMAVPHPGVVSAAMIPENEIMQPDELDGLGLYTIRASVTSPFVNVLCLMGMSRQDLNPVVDVTAGDSTEGTKTILDDIFQWGPQWGDMKWPPVFANTSMPGQYNSITNDTTGVNYGRDAIYVLGRGGDVDQTGAATAANYALCSIQAGLTPDCSTMYNASSRGGSLTAVCGDPDDGMRYINSMSNATRGNDTLSAEYVNVASEWANAISLNEGVVDANSSSVRIFTQLFLSNNSMDWKTGEAVLSNAMPSPAEALAVLAGCTLLQSIQDAPFYQFWNWSSTILEAGQTQYFNATVRAQQYASGGTTAYQSGFIVILLAAFVINAGVLLYLLLHRQWYLDFGDPVNLFPLALNSPPNSRLADSTCVGSPYSRDQYKHHWKLQVDGGHVYMDSPRVDGEELPSPGARRRSNLKSGFEMATRPISRAAGRLRRD